MRNAAMFGRRSDGRRIKGIDPIVALTPYIMPTRVDSQVFMKLNLNFDAMTHYIRDKRKEGHTITYMGLILAAYVRTVSQYPELNRFIMNKQLFARNHLCVSFVTLKKNDNDSIDESLIKLEFDPSDTIYQVSEKLEAAIEESRHPKNTNLTDAIARGLLAVPGLPTLIVGLARITDRYGFMPSIIHKASPFHTSLFISNMASLGMGAIYHHIYNFGTTSLFVSMGKTEQVIRANADGTCRNRRVMPIGAVIDERVCSGGGYARAFSFYSACLSQPDILESPPDEVKLETPLRSRKGADSQINAMG
jgi:hypothetical protein